jgi:hypothetical protein
MALTERALRFTFSGAPEGSFSAEGLRAIVSAQQYQGKLATQAQCRIWGLSLAQMNAYSSQFVGAPGLRPNSAIQYFTLSVEAGDQGGELSQFVNANIIASFIDLSEAPDSAFSVSVAGAIYESAQTIASQSKAGAQNAETLIQSVCAAAQLTLVNNGAHAVLNNMATYGSAIDQIEKIAHAAGFSWSISGSTVSIWPGDGTLDDTIIQVGPATDPPMVGYPQFFELGLLVRSLYNPQVQVGRQMQVTSSLPKANVTWPIKVVHHDLATMLRKGPWFTTAVLAPQST